MGGGVTGEWGPERCVGALRSLSNVWLFCLVRSFTPSCCMVLPQYPQKAEDTGLSVPQFVQRIIKGLAFSLLYQRRCYHEVPRIYLKLG
ncbi:hypothetical protein KSX_38250 [Ktedonospora formicarum]|uniref:Uncharacterized protein n=1 Tax=Ktedonospora formicarum TaxID=2778364 RepID=A0A8J3HX08_9CHLR|nr:hypothetical protein KSX_38250 [Ktedonospora formicarum]